MDGWIVIMLSLVSFPSQVFNAYGEATNFLG